MPLRRRHQRRKPRDEGQRLKLDRRSSPAGLGPAHPTPTPRGFAAPVTIGPRLLELQPHVSVVEDFQAVVGEWRAQDVFAQGQAAWLVVGGDLGCRVKIEAMVLGAQFAFGNGAVVRALHRQDQFLGQGDESAYPGHVQQSLRLVLLSVLGVSLTGNYAQLDGRDYLGALLGFYLRFPFGAGVVVLGH
jgi:hypothetical protein